MRQGADQQTSDPNTETRTALARRGASREPANGIRDLIERQKPEIARALTGTALDPERFSRIALSVIRQSPQLQRCRPESLLGALMTSAQLGLEPGPLGEIYLVPFKDECTVIIGYRGLIRLAWNSGQLRQISARVVCERDKFDYAFGLDPFLNHRPAVGERGEPVAVYACATLRDGGREFEVLSLGEIEAIRRRARASKDGPWVTDWSAMARKSAVRQLAKWLPLSTTMVRALSAEGAIRSDIRAEALDEFPAFPDDDVPSRAPSALPDSASQSTAGHPEPDTPTPPDTSPSAADEPHQGTPRQAKD